MIDIIKKTVLAGIGATVVTKEAVERQLQDLVDKGKMSVEEAQQTAENIVEEGRKEYDKARDDLGRQFEEMLHRANLAPISRVTELEKRIAELESKLAEARSGTTGT